MLGQRFLRRCAIGFAWFSVASKNRTLTREGKRPRRRIIDLVPGLLKHQGRNVRMKRARGWARFRLGMVDGQLKGIGQVRMVVRKRPRTPMTTATAVVTNQCSLDARTIVSIYERRWRIEELFKELRSDLGLGDYQVMSREGISITSCPYQKLCPAPFGRSVEIGGGGSAPRVRC